MKKDYSLVIEILNKNLEKYKKIVGHINYPFPIEDYAYKVFGLDIQYANFDEEFVMEDLDVKMIYGALYPDGKYFYGQEKVILINNNTNDFYIGDFHVPKEYYKSQSERQTIAHEVGHYAEFDYRKKEELNLFNDIEYNKALDIFIDPEVFANIYARNLLMPKEEVFKLKSELQGTIDMLNDSNYFREKFGVTQFMLEVRLAELKIQFINGYYINKVRRTNGEKYEEEDLLELIQLAKKYDMRPNYGDAAQIANIYNKHTDQDRDGGSLYMTIWRINQGKYDKIYESVAEARLKALNEITNIKK